MSFNAADTIIDDDLSIPTETLILYSKTKAIFEMVVGLATIGASVYFYSKSGQLLLAVFILGGAVFALLGFQHYNNQKPQITLNNDGVGIATTPFYGWGSITNEDTRIVQSGKSSITYFVYNCPDGEKQTNIAELDVSKSELEKLLRVYRKRYEHGMVRK